MNLSKKDVIIIIYQKIIDEIFIQIANENELKSGDFTADQEFKLERSINSFLESCRDKKDDFNLKNETELEKYSYRLLKKIALENDYKNYNKNGEDQENIIRLFKQYIEQNK